MPPTATSRISKAPEQHSDTPSSSTAGQSGAAARVSFWRRVFLRLLALYAVLIFVCWFFFGNAIKESISRTVSRMHTPASTQKNHLSNREPLPPAPSPAISPSPPPAVSNNTIQVAATKESLPSPAKVVPPVPQNNLPRLLQKGTLASILQKFIPLPLKKALSINTSRPTENVKNCTAQAPCHIMVEVRSFIAGERFNYDKVIKCSPEVECHWCSTGTCPSGKDPDADAYDLFATNWPPRQPQKPYMVTLGATIESGAYAGRNVKTASQNFDVVMTCDPKSDVPLVYLAWGDQLGLPNGIKPTIEGRKPVAAFVASNCEIRRKKLIERIIASGLPVHALGNCVPHGAERHRITSPKHPYAAKVEALLNYAIYLAFENSVADGYVTEKVFDGLRGGAITVYHGTPTVVNYVPNNSVILFDPNGDIKAQVDRIKSYMEPAQYATLQEWRKVPFYPAAFYWKELSSHCRGCQAIAKLRQMTLDQLAAWRKERKQQ